MKKPYSLKARVILINNTFLKVSLYKNMFFVKVRLSEDTVVFDIHCITQYYAKQGIFWKPGKTSKFRPIHSTI